MLVSLNELDGSNIKATDGDVGDIEDVYFDDSQWTIRFLVADTHPWLPLSQKVLISPIALLEYNEEERELRVSMTKEEVKNCPKVEEHETLSREFEHAYFDYFGYGYYWVGPGAWGEYAYPTALVKQNVISEDSEQDDSEPTNHMRSANEIIHYNVEALDGKEGYIKDFIWDTYNWSLCYLVVDTRDWLPGGKKVLICPTQLEALNWEDKTVKCNISLEQLKACPEYLADKLHDPLYLKSVKEQLQTKS